MAKQTWKPGNMIYPIPAVMVSVTDGKGQDDIITVAWTGTICTNPPMAYISVRPERFSYHMIKETGEFVINLTTEELAAATDYCGVRSGRDVDKFKETGLTREKGGYRKSTDDKRGSGINRMQSKRNQRAWFTSYVSGRGCCSSCRRTLYGRK